MFKSIVASIAIAATSFVAVAPEAQARNWDRCGYAGSIYYCVDTGRTKDVVGITDGSATEVFHISCYANDYKVSSYGPLSRSQMNAFAKSYCLKRVYG